MKNVNKQKVFIGADHGGFELKNKIIEYFSNEYNKSILSYNFVDVGAFSLDPDDDYVDYASQVCIKIQNDIENPLGILICRSGIGMSIVANKYKGIYAALCFSVEHAVKAREHNNANILCLDSDYSNNLEHTLQIVNVFIQNNYKIEDRHKRRIEKIKHIEKSFFIL